MRDLREISLRTYALAFAVVLSPALFQTSSLCQTGNPNLAGLELEVDGVNQIAFVPGQASYTVTMSSPTAILRAQSEDPAATISYQWWDGPTLLGTWTLGTGDVEATLDVPEGLRTLRVHVKAPGGAGAGTDIEITNSTAVAYPCTEVGIRQAISDGGGPHYFDCQAMTTVTTAYPIRINNDVILDGEGNLTVDGNDDHTVVLVDDGITAEIRGMTLTGGATTGVGGGIKSGDGNLTVTDSIISGNTARLGGGGIRSSGDLTLRSSIVSGNNNTLSNGTGGGIAHGGGTLTIVDSTISDNLANSGGGIKASGDGTITNSTISGNIARNGAGISNYSGDLTIMNSTISGNTALAGGGGIYNTESSGGAASLILVNTTISGNTAFEFGSSLMNNGNLAVLVLLNSVIAGECFISYGAPIAQYTIESPGDTCLLPAGQWNLDNVTAAELNLGPLQDNGGVTFTQAPLVGSVLIDHIHEVACEDFAGAPITSDQRGVSRPENIGCDVGSVEGYCDDCNDDLDCTVDLCDPIIRTCSHSTAADGSPCESGNGTCAAGVCMGPVRQWGTAELLESSDVNAVEPRVAMESLGNITVAWRESDGVSDNVWSSRFQPVGSPGGGWDAPVVISNINTPDVLDPELAMDSNGNVVAVWAQHNGTTNFEIWSNHFTPDPPAGWSAAEAISGPGG
ncbi:MAG: choice-of-anchor Q domain-containing protein, partial [Polyangiales bacterium]